VYQVHFGGSLLDLSFAEFLRNFGIENDRIDPIVNQCKKIPELSAYDAIPHSLMVLKLQDLLPYPVSLPMFAPELTRKSLADVMVRSLVRNHELHDMQVVCMMQVLQRVLSRSNIPQNSYEYLHPSSPHGAMLPSADALGPGTAGQVMLTQDHFEFLLINSELRRCPIAVGTGASRRIAAVFHSDSLDSRIRRCRLKPLVSVNSKMGQDIAACGGIANSVLRVPCVLQPQGSRICGLVTCVNLLLFAECSLEQIRDGGLDAVLDRLDLPDRKSWTLDMWERVGVLFCKEFLKIETSETDRESLLRRMAEVMRDEAYISTVTNSRRELTCSFEQEEKLSRFEVDALFRNALFGVWVAVITMLPW
jgi:hypothetical protein